LPLSVTDLPSPNFDSRGGCPVSMLVLHYTGMQTPQAAFERLRDPASRVSAHYLVDEQGGVFRLVAEASRAWHAGVSCWRGERQVNHASIGIELINPGHEWGYRPFPPAQMDALIALCKDILTRHAIAPRDVVAHSDVAPARKEDPGEWFDWRRLAAEGIGLWPGELSASGCQLSASEAESRKLTADSLSLYGYDTADLPKAILAFQRHFRPESLTGQWDADCENRLAALLRML
jgi:N-acetylmuramoyl-L-alanine amidase